MQDKIAPIDRTLHGEAVEIGFHVAPSAADHEMDIDGVVVHLQAGTDFVSVVTDEMDGHAMFDIADIDAVIEALTRIRDHRLPDDVRLARIADGTLPEREIVRIAEAFDASGVDPETMDAGTIALAEAAWAARDRIADGRPAAPPPGHTLVVVGWNGARRCYLDATREEAVSRYEGDTGEAFDDRTPVKEFAFVDRFEAYDAWI